MTDAPSRIGPRAFAPLMIAAVVVQIALWTTVAVLFMNSIENDVAEGAVDGPARQLSYLRHPPLSSWVTGFAELAGPARYWALYAAALSFACVAFAIVAGWIARREGAAAGWVALAGGLMSPYASYWPIKFNHNIGIMPFWALTLVAGWGAFTSEGTAGWLLFGAAVGAGMWAKYAILHLAVPLAIFFFISPDQRRKLATPGPWLAALLAAAIAAPHFYDAFSKGGTTLQWAVHATPMPAAARVGGVVVFLLGAAAANLTFALIAAVACGPRALLAGVAKILRRRNQTAFDRYLLFAALGPVLVIAAAGPFGVRLFYHWITPVSLSFAAFWATAAARAGLGAPPRRAIWLAALWIAATAAGFIAVREIAPFVLKAGDAAYGEMDADGLDQAIDAYWRANGAGPLRYIVSFGGKAGFQAAGSYEFDHGARVRVFEEADPRNAPWIDPADVARSGALVVSGSPPPDHVRLGARDIPVQSVTAIDRPLTRAQKAPPRLWLGVLAPVN